jgi:hypothetical protein
MLTCVCRAFKALNGVEDRAAAAVCGILREQLEKLASSLSTALAAPEAQKIKGQVGAGHCHYDSHLRIRMRRGGVAGGLPSSSFPGSFQLAAASFVSRLFFMRLLPPLVHCTVLWLRRSHTAVCTPPGCGCAPPQPRGGPPTWRC